MLKPLTSALNPLFSTLLLAEHTGKSLSKNTLKLLSASKKFNQQTHVLITSTSNTNTKQICDHLKSNVGAKYVDKVYVLNGTGSGITADFLENAVVGLIGKNGYKRVVGLASSFGKDVVPRIAGKFQAQPIGDITEIIDEKTFVRPTYAGNAFTKVKSEQPIDFLTIRASAFPQPQPGTNQSQIQQLPSSYTPKSTFLTEQKSDSSKPQLTTARIVVSGGRGVKSKQNFQVIYKLAEAFGDAAVGASRAAVDAGYCPNQMQVGQTGKVVAPDLYIAVGISGAVQHLAGMKDSKCIVAINNRADQPIYQYADYTLMEDLFKAVPELTEKVKKIKSN